MITSITGQKIDEDREAITLQAGGVGYRILTTRLQKLESKMEHTVFVHHHVGSDNQHSLYGFSDKKERGLFELFLKVSGIGPKTAQRIVESETTENIQSAILTGDVDFFTRVKGLGKKGAQKIILELKNTLVEPSGSETSGVELALLKLGFTRKEIQSVKSVTITDGLTEEEAISVLLQALGK